jgi:hypothetical protein
VRRALLALLIVLVAGGAWIAYTERWRHGGDTPIGFRAMPGGLDGAELANPVFLRFRKRKYLESYLAQHARGRVPPLPAIDWARDEVLLAAVGARSSTGYAVGIGSVSDQRSRIVVRVRETAPALGQPVAARVTYPYALATIPQSPKRVHFIWVGRP